MLELVLKMIYFWKCSKSCPRAIQFELCNFPLVMNKVPLLHACSRPFSDHPYVDSNIIWTEHVYGEQELCETAKLQPLPAAPKVPRVCVLCSMSLLTVCAMSVSLCGHHLLSFSWEHRPTLVSTSLSESLPEVDDNTSFDLGILRRRKEPMRTFCEEQHCHPVVTQQNSDIIPREMLMHCYVKIWNR